MTTPIEPNKSKTIPLHIADQAVAACEAEIKKLREENARLKQKSACQAEGLDAYDKKLREAESMVERLRKAGDAMAQFDPCVGYHCDFSYLVSDWNAAKDGKPSE